MAQKLITIEVDTDGNMTCDLAGYHGVGCDAVMAQFTKGQKVQQSKFKPEHKTVTLNTVSQ